MMLQQEKSTGNLNASGQHGNIANTILPAKSKTVRSYTNNNQSLEQIMKRANEIIKKSKNSSLLGGRPDISDILHPLTDSFVTLTTADSLQKNSQSTNREGCKVSPFVTVSSPEATDSKPSNPHSSDKSSKAKSKLPLGSGSQEDSAGQSQRINIAKQLHNNYMSEADYIFENFDSVFRVVFNPPSNNQGTPHGNNFAQKQSGTSQHASHSANPRDTDDCRISLAQVFERVRREEKCQQQQQQNKQNIPIQNMPNQQPPTQNPIHLRSHSSIVNTSEAPSYLIPKQVQQTISSFQLKNQQLQQQQQQQQQIQQQLSSSFNQPQTQLTQQSSHSKEINLNSSQSIPTTQQPTSQQTNMLQGEIEQYLKKPQPAKVKTQNGAPLHPHPPLPQSTKMNISGYNTNHFNAQRFRYRNSLRDKENIPEAANNTSIGQLNTSNGQIMTNPNKNGSFLCTPVAANHNNIPQPQQFQQPQQQVQQQQHIPQNQHSHQRSSSNIIDFNQNFLNNSQQNNSLQNSFGFYRPRFDSTSGPSNNNNNNGVSERLNTIGIDQNIKNVGYASLKERGSVNLGNQNNDISCDKSLNYSSMRVNTSYNGNASQSNNQYNSNTTTGTAQNSRTSSFQLNIPKMTVGKSSAATSILNSLIGGQKVQQPQPTNNNTNQNSNNTSMNQIAYNPTASTSSLGNRSTSVPRANLGYLLQKKYV